MAPSCCWFASRNSWTRRSVSRTDPCRACIRLSYGKGDGRREGATRCDRRAVILSEAKDLLLGPAKQILRFAQDDEVFDQDDKVFARDGKEPDGSTKSSVRSM